MKRSLAAFCRQNVQALLNLRTYRLCCHLLSLLVILKPLNRISALGTLPDASQEGLLWQFKSYSNVALFHYNVPSEVTRATWEFAAFQDDPSCPKRKVHIYLQHGAYPVFNGYPKINESQEDFPSYFYVDRTSLIHMTTISAYQPTDSTVFPVYNPLPGDWYASAYLEPFEEKLGGFMHRCRYSLGSIAIWSRAESVDLILTNSGGETEPNTQLYQTRKHFSYYKFFVPDDAHRFKLIISNCFVNLKHYRASFNNDSCIDYVAYRGRALPIHDPDMSSGNGQKSSKSLSTIKNVTFIEERPLRSSYYYVLVVSHGRVTFNIDIKYYGCGQVGLYGPSQREWYLNERGLMYGLDSVSAATNGQKPPKEPTTGFQLFASRQLLDKLKDDKNYDLVQLETNSTTHRNSGSYKNESTETNNASEQIDNGGKRSDDPLSYCISTFDFTRTDNLGSFSVGYILQGKSWYTKWLTVLEMVPVFTRFDVLPYLDVGGNLAIRIGYDNMAPLLPIPTTNHSQPSKQFSKNEEKLHHKMNSRDPEQIEAADEKVHQLIYGCLSKDREPRLTDDRKKMICNNHASTLTLYNSLNVKDTLKVIPYPEPGRWYLGFQVRCYIKTLEGGNKTVNCPDIMVSTMISINIELQPCGYRKENYNVCGDHGICATVHKGNHRLSSCTCSAGYTGWTCEDGSNALPRVKLLIGTLLLTMSNLAFLPAVLLAVRYRLFGEGLVYFAAMSFSTFYHTCDEATSSYADFPGFLDNICARLFVDNQVLQFCDFYAATLSLWVTIVALAPGLSHGGAIHQFLNFSGVLIVAVLVQYNRTGLHVFAVPLALGLIILLASVIVRRYRSGRFSRPSSTCLALVFSAILCSVLALCLTALVATTYNYAYVHSTWHVLLATSLTLLLPRCNRNGEKSTISNSSATMSKTSDIGVGTAELTTGRKEDLPNELLPPFPQQTNDTLTIVTSVSDHSISLEEDDRISERCDKNTNDDTSNKETDNDFHDQTTNATIGMKYKENYSKEIAICSKDTLNGNEDNILMKELSIGSKSVPKNLGAISDEHDLDIPRNLKNGYSGAYNQGAKDNHTNNAFIDEEKQS